MENAEEILQVLERFTKLKQKDIPKELDEYLIYVAKTGDTLFSWANIKYLFREKLIHVIKDFHDSTSNIDDLPQYPNVDPFNYETMKTALLERLELFNSAPFTIQRICELLTNPKKQYSRIDKFMRALEKNILVVSTIEPGRKQPESENGDSLDSVVISLDVNVDIEMENESIYNAQNQRQQNGSNGMASSAITSKLEAEKHKINDDIDLPSAKKAKLDLEDEDSMKNDVHKNDIKEKESAEIDVDSKKQDNNIDCTTENSENENNKENDNDSENENDNENDNDSDNETDEKCAQEISKEKSVENDDKENEINKKQNCSLKNEDVNKDVFVKTNNSDKNEKKKTDIESEEEEEDKLLNVDDESTIEKVEQQEEKKRQISTEKDKSTAFEKTHSASTIEENMKNKENQQIKQDTAEPEEEKKIELFSTDDVVEPPEPQKKNVQHSENDTIDEKTVENENDILVEKCEMSDIDKNTESIDVKEKPLEEMSVEESNEDESKIELNKIATPESPPPTNELNTDIEPITVIDSEVPIDESLEDSVTEKPVIEIEITPIDPEACVEMKPIETNEMSTDDVSPPKIDEKLGGMDVDDVSQAEAMDQ